MKYNGNCSKPKQMPLGPPGAGKGTLCGRLANGSNVVHISVGDRCRDAAKEPTDLGREIQGYMEKKELLPTRLIIKLLGDLIEKEFIGGGRQFLLDGFPRSADQAMLLKTHVKRPVQSYNLALSNDRSLKQTEELFHLNAPRMLLSPVL